MPVTAVLSKRFYDVLGEDITNELVNWFNQVDASYRADLREFNELNFARFDAKLEQRISELGAELRTEMHAMRDSLLRWMFGLCAASTLALAGLILTVLQVLR